MSLKPIALSLSSVLVTVLVAAPSYGQGDASAADSGLVSALCEAAVDQKAGLEVRAHDQSALAGALGAALWGAFRARRLAARGVPLAAGAA